jgi:hypothetical protein
MSIFTPKLARYNTIQCQNVKPVSVTFLLQTKPPTPISGYDLPFNPVIQTECPPDIVPIQIGEWPNGTQQPPGAILVSTSALTPEGYVECNGASYATAMYPLLYKIIGTYYGDVGGPGTFNVPNLSNASYPNAKYIIKVDDSFHGYGNSLTFG